MCSGGSDWTCLQPGFPIRKSSDHSLVIDSPRLIADSYVLLRFLVPRHPPCALKNLSHKDARVHCVVLNVRVVPHRGPTPLAPWAVVRRVVRSAAGLTGSRRSCSRPSPQDPTTCQAPTRCVRPFHCPKACTRTTHHASTPTNRCSTLEHLS